MRVPGGLEWLTLEKPFIGAFHTNSYSLLNGHGYSRMAEDYRMLSKEDALSWCECAVHILMACTLGHEFWPFLAVVSRSC